MSILTFLGIERKLNKKSLQVNKVIRNIVAQLNTIDPKRAQYIAAFAYILSRVAHADLCMSKEESQAIKERIMQVGGLPQHQAVLIVEMVKKQNELFGATQDWLVTREFNRIATHKQKLALLHCLFSVAAAEGGISSAEDTLIRQISSELKLDHEDFIAVRVTYCTHLNVLARVDKI